MADVDDTKKQVSNLLVDKLTCCTCELNPLPLKILYD